MERFIDKGRQMVVHGPGNDIGKGDKPEQGPINPRIGDKPHGFEKPPSMISDVKIDKSVDGKKYTEKK
jgi:hypothetical protein